TTKLLERERNNDDNLNNLITMSENMSKSYEIDPDKEFNYKHRQRRPPKRIDENPQTAHKFTRLQY
ncbi:unnamed protein product, partial [Didymodactylos carnosus]